MPIALITLIDESKQWIKASVGIDEEFVPREHSLCQYLLNHPETLYVPDITRDPRFSNNVFAAGSAGFQFYAGAPIILTNGSVLGSVCVMDTVQRELTNGQIASLERLARLTSCILDQRRAAGLMHTRRAGDRRKTVMASESEATLRKLTDNVPAIVARIDRDFKYLFYNRRYREMTGIAEDAAIGLDVRDALGPEAFKIVLPRMLTVLSGVPVTFEATIPYFKAGTRHMLISYMPDFSADGAVASFVLSAIDITERKQLEAERERLLVDAVQRADLDPLTGLMNHRAFHKKFEEEARSAVLEGASLGIAMMDLNNFKFFNDAYGHLIGDDVLRRTANALATACKAGESLARFGGDEFVAIIPGATLSDETEIVNRFKREIAAVAVRPPDHDTDVPLELSVGFSVYPTETSVRIEALALADERLYRAKNGGGDDIHCKLLRQNLTKSVDGFSMLDALVTAVDNKDRYTLRHSEDVLSHSAAIAHEMGLDELTRHDIAVAALLHDVGKIGVPDFILRKPGKLTYAEFEAMKHHPLMGAVIVNAIPGFEATLGAIQHHHERWDGGGYPFGLVGECIPFVARLLAVADAFSAMTTDRPYKKAMPEATALQILVDGSGSQWDPNCVAAFVRSRSKRSDA